MIAMEAAAISGPQLVPPSRFTNSCIPTGSVFISLSLDTRSGQRHRRRDVPLFSDLLNFGKIWQDKAANFCRALKDRQASVEDW